MRPDDPSLKRMTPPKLNILERTYLPQILGGLLVTGRHMVASMTGQVITEQYPEEQHIPSSNYRGVHRLNKDENGRIKCVACMLCATACPAHCIDIVGANAPDTWDDREKYPENFIIDELRCIYCGMCEGGVPGRRDRADRPVRPDWAFSRANDFRQDEAALGVRPHQGLRADEDRAAHPRTRTTTGRPASSPPSRPTARSSERADELPGHFGLDRDRARGARHLAAPAAPARARSPPQHPSPRDDLRDLGRIA